MPTCLRVKDLDESSNESRTSFSVPDRIRSKSPTELSLSFEEDDMGRGKLEFKIKEAQLAHSPGLPRIMREGSIDDVLIGEEISLSEKEEKIVCEESEFLGSKPTGMRRVSRFHNLE